MFGKHCTTQYDQYRRGGENLGISLASGQFQVLGDGQLRLRKKWQQGDQGYDGADRAEETTERDTEIAIVFEEGDALLQVVGMQPEPAPALDAR